MNGITPTQRALNDVANERIVQDVTWGPARDLHPTEWLTILMEEVGEVAEVLNDTHEAAEIDLDAYRAELTQVAAVAIAAIEHADRMEENRRLIHDAMHGGELSDG